MTTGFSAFVQTHVTLDVYVDPDEISEEQLPRGGFQDVLTDAMLANLPNADPEDDVRAVRAILSNGAQFALRDMVADDPSLIGQTVTMTVPASDPFDQLNKGNVDRATPEGQRRVNDREIEWFDTLDEAGMITTPLNFGLITNADSRFPELAGLRGGAGGVVLRAPDLLPDRVPGRHRCRDLSRGIRPQEQGVGLHRGQHQQPGGRAVGGLRLCWLWRCS